MGLFKIGVIRVSRIGVFEKLLKKQHVSGYSLYGHNQKGVQGERGCLELVQLECLKNGYIYVRH